MSNKKNMENLTEIMDSASDALETLSCKIATVSDLAALALSEVGGQHDMRPVEILLNAIIDSLEYQSDEVLHWSKKLFDCIRGKHE